jgi:microsomal dipeptidase-like Zn-dependent dipeptidase
MRYMTRTTDDLINELDTAVTDQDTLCGMTQTALVVGFNLECKMIFHNESDRLQKLTTMVQDGGKPLGFIKVVKIGNDFQFLSKPLTGFEKNEKIKRILTELCTIVGKTMAFRDAGGPSSPAVDGSVRYD